MTESQLIDVETVARDMRQMQATAINSYSSIMLSLVAEIRRLQLVEAELTNEIMNLIKTQSNPNGVN